MRACPGSLQCRGARDMIALVAWLNPETRNLRVDTAVKGERRHKQSCAGGSRIRMGARYGDPKISLLIQAETLERTRANPRQRTSRPLQLVVHDSWLD